MKKTFLTTAIMIGYFTVMSTFGIIASVPSNVNNVAKEKTRKEISNQVTCPSFITENSDQNDVKAIVQVDKTGEVNVLSITSGNPALTEYVENQLTKIKVNASTNDRFVLVIKFRVV